MQEEKRYIASEAKEPENTKRRGKYTVEIEEQRESGNNPRALVRVEGELEPTVLLALVGQPSVA